MGITIYSNFREKLGLETFVHSHIEAKRLEEGGRENLERGRIWS